MCNTLTGIDKKGHHGLLLKVQGGEWRKGTIRVSYEADSQEVGIETYRRKPGWTTLGTFPRLVQEGDVLTGQAFDDGTVRVFVNRDLVGEAYADMAKWFIGAERTCTPSHVFP